MAIIKQAGTSSSQWVGGGLLLSGSPVSDKSFSPDFSGPGPRIFMKIGRVVDFYMEKTLINFIFNLKLYKMVKIAKKGNF